MSDYFRCPRCGIVEPVPSDDRAREQGVCSDCWHEYYMEDWYQLDRAMGRRNNPSGNVATEPRSPAPKPGGNLT